MSPPIVALICAVAVFLIAVAIVFVFRAKDPYKRKKSVLTDSENYFYYLLVRLVPSECVVIPQTPVIACFDTKVTDRAALNKIISKRFDFTIAVNERTSEYPHCRLVTIAAIELDDRSHEREDRIKRDSFVNRLCETHALPLLRYKTKTGKAPSYDEHKIRSDIEAALALYRKYKD